MIKPVSTVSHAIEFKVVLEEYCDKYSQIQAGDGDFVLMKVKEEHCGTTSLKTYHKKG